MENNKLKATKEQAERLDFVISEMDRIKNGETSELKYYKLLPEYEELVSNYDWSDEVFEENGKKGLKNVKGEVVVPAIYDKYGILEPYYLPNYGVPASQEDLMMVCMDKNIAHFTLKEANSARKTVAKK